MLPLISADWQAPAAEGWPETREWHAGSVFVLDTSEQRFLLPVRRSQVDGRVLVLNERSYPHGHLQPQDRNHHLGTGRVGYAEGSRGILAPGEFPRKGGLRPPPVSSRAVAVLDQLFQGFPLDATAPTRERFNNCSRSRADSCAVRLRTAFTFSTADTACFDNSLRSRQTTINLTYLLVIDVDDY